MGRESLFAFRLGRLGAWLTRRFLSPPDNCYPGFGDGDYHRPVAIAWNLYRCVTCAAKREPERVYHRTLWRLTRGAYDPFGRSAQGQRPW
jgi:hypothetical protein